ncbi:hypothetical protein DXG01_003156, partial [Tephrocybe rancida]
VLTLVAARLVVPQLALNPDGQLQGLNLVSARLVVLWLALGSGSQNNLILCSNHTHFRLQDLNLVSTRLVIPQLALNPQSQGLLVCDKVFPYPHALLSCALN